MKFTLITRDLGNTEQVAWRDPENRNEVKTKLDAVIYGQNVIRRFNSSLRAGEQPRELLFIDFADNDADAAILEHDFKKSSLVTEAGGYDRYRCNECGIFGRRYGFGAYISIAEENKALMKKVNANDCEAVQKYLAAKSEREQVKRFKKL